MPAPHWTDVFPSPVFDSVIHADGPRGNVFAILGTATSWLRQLEVPRDRISCLRIDVTSARSYDEAIGHIERWFKVER